MIRLASFDIGVRNFAQYVEEFDPNEIYTLEKRYKSLPKQQQRRVKGTMNSAIEELLVATAMCGTRVTTGVYDFTHEKGQGLDVLSRKQLLAHLTRFEKVWDTCDIFVIEQQFFNTTGFGGKKKAGSGANVDAIKIAEATFMWLLDRYPFKTIIYFGSQFKTQIFGAPLKMTKTQRKNWATVKAEEFYRQRCDAEMGTLFDLAEGVKRKRITTEARVQSFKDEYPVESSDCVDLANKLIRDKQKLDDVADAFMQAQAFKFRAMVGCF